MKDTSSIRKVPESVAAVVVMAVLLAFELLVLFGGLEIKSSSVAAAAPWAFNAFSRLVGEHPDQMSARAELIMHPAEESASVEEVFEEMAPQPFFLLSDTNLVIDEDPDEGSWLESDENELERDDFWTEAPVETNPPAKKADVIVPVG